MVRLHAVVVNRVFVRSVCGHIVGLHVFVVHGVCCSFARASHGLFFMWLLIHVGWSVLGVCFISCVLHVWVLRLVRVLTVAQGDSG